MVFVLPGEVPSKKNSRINTLSGRSFPSKRYMEWRDMAVMEVRSQLKGWKAPVPCSIIVTFYHGDRRRRDADNGVTSILDMLKDAGVLIDDCWEYVPHKQDWNALDRGHARCAISIEPLR